MHINKAGLAFAAAAAVAALALNGCSRPSQPAAATNAPACDRQCLIDATNKYVAAVVAHDPSQAPLASQVAFVENITKMQPGEGLWKSAVKGPDNFIVHVPDAVNQTAGYMAMMTYIAPPRAPQGATPEVRAEYATRAPVEQPLLVAIRLKFDGQGRISEAEHLLTGVTEAQMVNLRAPRPGISTEIPEAQRKSHEELIRIGLSYYDALDENDGTLTPFAPDCERHENGMITAGGAARPGGGPVNTGPQVSRDCAEQLSSNTFQYIDRIENRRVFAADPVTGLVMGLSHFRHPMDNLPYKVKAMDGTEIERTKADFSFAPFDLPAAHIFKIGADGLMHEIEAMGFQAPYNSPTGWE